MNNVDIYEWSEKFNSELIQAEKLGLINQKVARNIRKEKRSDLQLLFEAWKKLSKVVNVANPLLSNESILVILKIVEVIDTATHDSLTRPYLNSKIKKETDINISEKQDLSNVNLSDSEINDFFNGFDEYFDQELDNIQSNLHNYNSDDSESVHSDLDDNFDNLMNMADENPGPAQAAAAVAPAQQDRFKITDFLPPVFNGETDTIRPTVWFVKFRDYVDLQQVPNAQLLTRMKLCTEGMAREWLNALNNINNIEDLERAFLARFGAFKTREALLEALSQKKLLPGVSVNRYLSDIREMVERLELPQASVKDYFQRGLPSSVRTALFYARVDNLDAMLKFVQELIEREQLTGTPSQDIGTGLTFPLLATPPQKNISDDILMALTSLPEKVATAIQAQQPSPVETKIQSSLANHNVNNGNSNDADTTIRRDRQTYDQNEKRVRFRTRPTQNQNRFNYGPSLLTCYYCGANGHIMRNCKWFLDEVRMQRSSQPWSAREGYAVRYSPGNRRAIGPPPASTRNNRSRESSPAPRMSNNAVSQNATNIKTSI